MRAAGLQGDPSSEIIEILDDDTNAFGDRAPSHTIVDVGGPKWIGPLAALALVGMIGFGVATSSSGGSPKAAPSTSTTGVPRTTLPAPTTTEPPAPPVPYYAADPPRPYEAYIAEFLDPGGFTTENYQLWAEPAATATSGSWFSIVSLGGQLSLSARNAYRLRSDRGSLAITHLPLGQTSVQYSADRSSSVVLTAFGWTDEDLVRLVESITLGGDEPVFTDPSLIAGYQMISAVEPWLVVQGLPMEEVYYASVADPYSGIYISVAPLDTVSEAGPALDRATALRFLLDHATPFTVDGHQAVAGRLAGQSDFGLASWTAGDHIVTVAGQLPVPQLIAVARTVHQVPAAEWEDMRLQVARNNSEDNNSVPVDPRMVPVSYGVDTEGVAWTIRVGLATYGSATQINWDWTDYRSLQSTVMTLPDDTARINTFVDDDRAYVLADLPRGVAASAELRVSRGGLDPVVVPFNDTDPTSARTFAAYAFSEPGPYTAQVVGADGVVLATWPSP